MNDFSSPLHPLNPINPASPLHPNNMDYQPIYKEEPDNSGIPIVIGFLFMLFLALIIRKK